MKYVYVALGATIGSFSRYLLSLSFPLSQFPWHTFFVNSLGSLFLGMITFHPKIPQNVRYLLGVGCLGSFTTFSTFTYDFIQLFKQGHFLTAIIYIFMTISIGITCAYVGMFFVKGREAS